MTSPSFDRLRLAVHLLSGGSITALAILGDRLLGNPPEWGPAQWVGLAAGLSVVAWGLLVRRGRLAEVSTALGVGFLVVLGLFALVEVALQAAGHDFAREEEQWLAIPTYFQKPVVPTGEAYFRRSGPQRYEGQVLNTRLSQLRIVPNPFADERRVTVDYDADGFRNPLDLEDWVVAVTGDSFTELGYLVDDELHTSILARELGVPVKNLGVSQTGNLSQVSYLRDYGLAPSTRHLVVLWFEGNDPLETMMESRELARLRETGQRPLREFEVQSSFLRAVYDWIVHPRNKGEHDLTHALFPSSEGDLPVTVNFAPRDFPDLPAEFIEDTRAALELAFGQLARLAQDQGATAWLFYMPCKLRVHREGLRFIDRTPERIRSWEPSRLPESIAAMCEAQGIRFQDLTPALRAAARESGELLYNTVYDTHLNARGAAVVGEQLARVLGPHVEH